jgi:hypothetical protein
MNIDSIAGVVATVTNDPTNLGVNWSVTCGSVHCGSFNPTSTASAVATQFTAPATIPSGNTVTVTATSVADNTKSISATITITQGPAISVTLNPAPRAQMNVSSAAPFTAVVANDPQNAGVNWSVTCGSVHCGSFNPTSTASAVATQFTAPATIPSGNTVTVTATSVADNTKSISATITITQGPAISVTLNPAPRAQMNASSTAPFTAVVANDPQNAGVNWSVTCGSVHCGSFNPTSTASAVATQFTAPATIPSGGNTVTVTATSVADNTKSASATVTISQAAIPLSDGTYVFHLSGNDFTAANGESNYFVAGAFTVSGGFINGGEQDFVDYNDAPTDSINPATSSITVTADGNVQIVLDTGDSAIGVDGIETLTASFVNSTRALIGEYDAFATGTGTLDWQTSQAAPSGGYAFFASGIDHNTDAIAFGGVLNVDGPGLISGTGSVFDFNDAFFQGLGQNQSFSPSTALGPSGSITPDSFGRIVFTLNPTNPNIGQIVMIGYIVDNSTIQLLETADALGGTTGGTALSQGANTGTFSSDSLSGLTYVVGAKGVDANGPLQLAGALAFSSTTNNVSGIATFNDIANQLSGNISAGTYLVDTTGRVTLMALSGSTFNNATMQLYLDGNGNALALSMDTSDVTAGYAFQQFASASFSGSYAVSADGSALLSSDLPSTQRFPWSAVGQIFADSSGNVSGFTDFNILTVPATPNVQLYGTATGSAEILSGALTGMGVAASGADTFNYYLIDDLRTFAIETDATQLNLAYFEQAPPSK